MHVSAAGLRHSSHQAEVAWPARQLYDLVADAAAGPLVFPGTVHVEWLTRTPAEETLRIWALNGTTARRWTSRRLLRPGGLSVTFRQERPEPPVSFMEGRWQMIPLASARTLVTLTHAYRAVDDDPDGTAWIEDLVGRVSLGQLTALREFAAHGAPVVVTETADLDCPVDTAYALAEGCDAWGIRHDTIRWPVPDLQVADLIAGGCVVNERARQLARVCFPGSHIAFKDMLPAAPVAAHIGCLRFSGTPAGTRAQARELVVLSRTVPPGTVPPGTVPPGTVPPGTAGGTVPPGTTFGGALLAALRAPG